ncbi:hypothetical protein GALMADRAFT_1299168 [Galerina marginata CBS 339.88]|uniref:Nudix hydrolase domain-containing protein n=1 Tax=Galerina marginata (strain CBS 339.88) TaxID=685588 RepID=A0A067T4K7_GALM3|nr:hypothetical protein GALMADRAFT_1299168 [Galerina marginata CBS 339.88]
MAPLFVSESAQPFDVPLSDLRVQHLGKRLVVGVAIIARVYLGQEKNSQEKWINKLLLLHRAETEDVYPLMYELLGGGAEPEDATLLNTVVRETKEETGLSVIEIRGVFPGFEYETTKSKAIQFNFVVGVEARTGVNIRLNPKEHCGFVWIDKKDDLSCYPMTESMKRVVSDALTVMAESASGHPPRRLKSDFIYPMLSLTLYAVSSLLSGILPSLFIVRCIPTQSQFPRRPAPIYTP